MIDESYPRLATLERWLAGGEPEVSRPQALPVLAGRDLYGPRPEVRPENVDLRKLLGEEHFVKPKAPPPKRLKQVPLLMISRMLDRKTQQISQWARPPGGPSGQTELYRRKLPRAHRRLPRGHRFFWDDEVEIIMYWARRDKLIITCPGEELCPKKRAKWHEEGKPHKNVVDLHNFTSRVTDQIEALRRTRHCECGECVPPLKDLEKVVAKRGITKYSYNVVKIAPAEPAGVSEGKVTDDRRQDGPEDQGLAGEG